MAIYSLNLLFQDHCATAYFPLAQLKQKICTSVVENFNFLDKMLRMIPQLMLWLLLNQCILAETDCDWLRLIYHRMGGDVNSVPRDCCRMDGVRCTDGDVTSIYWEDQGLTGSLPEELGNLVNLRQL
jgi:hypothetical protein